MSQFDCAVTNSISTEEWRIMAPETSGKSRNFEAKGEYHASGPSSLIANAHNELTMFYTGKR